MTRVLPRLARLVLTAGAVLGAICLVLFAVGPLMGIRPLLFKSGSMEPAIGTGDIAIARHVDASDLRVGDIVSVPTGEGDKRVAHRVVDVARQGNSAVLTLRGDANESADAQTYRVDGADRVMFVVPEVGHVVAAMSSPIGIFLSGLAAGGLLFLAVRGRGSGGRDGGSGPAGRRRASRSTVAMAAAASLAVAGPAGAAGWADDVGINGTSLTAHVVTPPASTDCSSLLLAATVSWEADPLYDYSVQLIRISNSSVVSTTQVTGTNSSITYTGLASFGLVVGAGTVDFRVEIKPYLAQSPSWISSGVATYSAIRVLAIALGATATCTT